MHVSSDKLSVGSLITEALALEAPFSPGTLFIQLPALPTALCILQQCSAAEIFY